MYWVRNIISMGGFHNQKENKGPKTPPKEKKNPPGDPWDNKSRFFFCITSDVKPAFQKMFTTISNSDGFLNFHNYCYYKLCSLSVNAEGACQVIRLWPDILGLSRRDSIQSKLANHFVGIIFKILQKLKSTGIVFFLFCCTIKLKPKS